MCVYYVCVFSLEDVCLRWFGDLEAVSCFSLVGFKNHAPCPCFESPRLEALVQRKAVPDVSTVEPLRTVFPLRKND